MKKLPVTYTISIYIYIEAFVHRLHKSHGYATGDGGQSTFDAIYRKFDNAGYFDVSKPSTRYPTLQQ